MTEPRRSANTGRTEYGVVIQHGCGFSVITHARRRMTLEEAERGDLPKPFSPEEWRAMAEGAARLDNPIRR